MVTFRLPSPEEAAVRKVVSFTEPVGWNARELFQDNFLAPYGVWRQLRFLEFKINLWNLITEHLNETLAEIGTKMGFQAAIEQTGLPTLKDVEDAKNDLQTGRRNLTDLVKFTI